MTANLDILVNDINTEFGPKRPLWANSNVVEAFRERLQYGSVELFSGPATLVDSSGLVDPDSEDTESVWFVFEYNGELFRIDGTYSSWNGSVYDTPPYRVQSKEVTKLVYVRQ